MRLANQLREFIQAGFAGMWIQSFEHEDAIGEISELCQAEDWQMATWDIDAGMQARAISQEDLAVVDPLTAVRSLGQFANDEQPSLLVLRNFHRFLGSAEIAQATARQIINGKSSQRFIIVLSPIVQIPVELEKLFVCVEHELPSRDEIATIAQDIATEQGELPEGDAFQAVLDAASGLTRYEAEASLALSLVRHGRVEPTSIWELKGQSLTKSGLLDLHRGQETFSGLGGLASLKAFCLRALRHRGTVPGSVKSKGILLLGVPGTGKSVFAKALGNEVGRPTLTLDVGKLMAGIVGQTEERTRKALQIVDAMQPAILFVDELEKAMAGSSSSGQSDSGVSARLLGTLLTWLADHESDVFVICTANDISKLPPELTRAERFDAIFFLDLPGKSQKEAIWQMYLDRFELDPSQELPSDASWTGAEIRACCRLAALLNVSLVQAAQNVVPVAVTSKESVQRLRSWASGRCLSAESDGVFTASTSTSPKRRRTLPKNPETN